MILGILIGFCSSFALMIGGFFASQRFGTPITRTLSQLSFKEKGKILEPDAPELNDWLDELDKLKHEP